jgi:hypothetical protein
MLYPSLYPRSTQALPKLFLFEALSAAAFLVFPFALVAELAVERRGAREQFSVAYRVEHPQPVQDPAVACGELEVVVVVEQVDVVFDPWRPSAAVVLEALPVDDLDVQLPVHFIDS